MERAFADPAAFGMPPRDANEPFRIMIWAHGGLISEQSGLAIATKHLQFWKANGIYPIYFVWETGLMQTLGQLLRSLGSGGRDARNFFSDTITDPLIETTLRAVGAEKIWSGMKRNAELGSTPQGGATRTAVELKKFCDRHAGVVRLHAAGHSAGAIFHAHFLPVAFGAGLPDVEQLHLLAPAIRVDAFKSQLMPLVGGHIKHLALFTMVKDQEARRRLREGLSQVAAVPDPVLVREGRESGDSRAGGVAAPRPRRGAAVRPRRRPLGVCRRRLLAVGRQRWRPRLPFDHARRIRR